MGVLYLAVFNQWLMVRLILMMHFILWNVLFDDAFYLNLFKTLFIQSFIFTPIPIISNNAYPSFQTLNFLSHSKIFKQTLSIACL